MHFLDLLSTSFKMKILKFVPLQQASKLKLGRPFTCSNLDLIHLTDWLLHCFPIKSCLGGSQELKCQELMGSSHPKNQHCLIPTQHNQQQHGDVKMETSSNTYRSLLSDIKYLKIIKVRLMEHRQNIFVMLSRFWPLRGEEVESIC